MERPRPSSETPLHGTLVLATFFEETPLELLATCIVLGANGGIMPQNTAESLKNAMYHLADKYMDALNLKQLTNTKERRIEFLENYKRLAARE